MITTAGSAEKCAACRQLGADVAVNYKTEDFVAATKAATDGKGADLILDMVGGDYIERNYEAAAVDGRVVQIAFQGEPQGDGRFPPPDVQAPHPHRLRAARPLGPRQGRDRARGRRPVMSISRSSVSVKSRRRAALVDRQIGAAAEVELRRHPLGAAAGERERRRERVVGRSLQVDAAPAPMLAAKSTWAKGPGTGPRPKSTSVICSTGPPPMALLPSSSAAE